MEQQATPVGTPFVFRPGRIRSEHQRQLTRGGLGDQDDFAVGVPPLELGEGVADLL